MVSRKMLWYCTTDEVKNSAIAIADEWGTDNYAHRKNRKALAGERRRGGADRDLLRKQCVDGGEGETEQ